MQSMKLQFVALSSSSKMGLKIQTQLGQYRPWPLRTRTDNQSRRHSQIPTCLIVTGPAISSYGYLYREVVQYDSLGQTTVMINITSTQCPNLKAGLKHIIRQGMSRIVLGDDEEDGIEFRPVSGQHMD